MSDMKMYNILGAFNNVDPKMTPVKEEVNAEPVYESVEPRGSIMEAVASLEEKYMGFKAVEKAAKEGGAEDPEAVAAAIGRKKYGKKKFQKAAAAGKKLGEETVEESGGPYELYNPKHPKFAANYKKFKAKNPDCKLEDFIAAMKKKEHGVNEGEYDPAPIDPEAVAKRKRLQAIKDRQEDQGDIYGKEKNTPIRKVAGKAYGGAAQKDDAEKDDLDEVVRVQHPYGKGQEFTSKWERDEAAFQAKRQRDINRNTGVYKSGAKERKGALSGTNTTGGGSTTKSTAYNDEFSKKWVARDAAQGKPVAEVAPPGAKAERMVKHIKKGYAKDGKLTKREKGIAYATAWKAHNKGQVEEGVQFGDTIANSKAGLKKAKLAKVTESRVMEETDYFYEKIAKSLAEKNPTLDTASGDFVTAVRKEMVAQGMEPNRARNIIMIDDDFISDVATSYGHYCREIAECGAPVNSFVAGTDELDEIARLAGLPVEEDEMEEGNAFTGKLADTPAGGEFELDGKTFKDTSTLDEREQFQSMPQGYASNTPKAPAVNPNAKSTFDKSKLNPMREEEMEEGNEFSGALAAAKASGAKEFEVDGKKYTVKEAQEKLDEMINATVNFTADDLDAVTLMKLLSGIDYRQDEPAQPAQDQAPLEAPQPTDNTVPQAGLEEERDVEYTNTPREETAGVDAAIPSGTDLNRAKKQYKKEYPGDNPMAVKEEALWKAYESMIDDVKE